MCGLLGAGRDTSPLGAILPWLGAEREQEEAGESPAAGAVLPRLRPQGPDEGFCPFR